MSNNNNSNANFELDQQALERELSGSMDSDPLAVLQHPRPVQQPRILETARPVPGYEQHAARAERDPNNALPRSTPAPAPVQQPRPIESPRPPQPVASAPAQPAPVQRQAPTPNNVARPAEQLTVSQGQYAGKTHSDAIDAEVLKERASVKSQRANNIANTERNIDVYNLNIERNDAARRVAIDETTAKFDSIIATTQSEIARVQEYLVALNGQLAAETTRKEEVLLDIEITFEDKREDLTALRDSEQARLDVLKRSVAREAAKAATRVEVKGDVSVPSDNNTSTGAVKSRPSTPGMPDYAAAT